MKKLLIICGPTATGKTKLALQLAKRFDGEILSADSRQVYKGMDIGTGKDVEECTIYNLQFTINDFQIGYYEIDGVKVWLLDIVEPDYRFNVADYKQCADMALKAIGKRKKLPILVGGTGFYIKAITDGIETIGVEPDWELRERLSHCSIVSLLGKLKGIDSERYQRMNESDRLNPRRLIRAIEIATKTQISNLKSQNQISNLKTNNLFVGLKAPNETLYQSIDQRVNDRVKAGLEDEIRGLLKKGYTWKDSVLGTTLAYREWEDFFAGKSTKEQVIQKWKFDEHDYARRQMTWFKKDPRIKWVDITVKDYTMRVEKLVGSWYSKDS